jgi:hypothetical protein
MMNDEMESKDSGFQLEVNPTSNCRQSSKHPDAKKNTINHNIWIEDEYKIW